MTYETFTMESFDDPASTSLPARGDYVFNALYDNRGSTEGEFENLVADSMEDARRILDNAAKILQEAKDKATLIEQQAYEKGFAQGEKDGREMGAKQLDSIVEHMERILKEIVDYKDGFARLHEKQILGLICQIAEKVVRCEVKKDKAIVREAILQAFSLSADRSEVTVKVSPEDIESVKDLRPKFFERFNDIKTVTVESDSSISPGGCLLETAFGHVDARIENQLEKIADCIREAYEQGSEKS